MNSITSSYQNFLPLVRDHIFSFLDSQSFGYTRLVCKEWDESSKPHLTRLVDQALKNLSFTRLNQLSLNKKMNILKFNENVKNLDNYINENTKKIKLKINSNFLKSNSRNKNLTCEFGSYVVIATNSTSYQIFNSSTSSLIDEKDDKILINFNKTKNFEQKMNFQALTDEIFIVCYNQTFIVRHALTGEALLIVNDLPDSYQTHFHNNQLFYINQNFQLVGYDFNTQDYLTIESDPTFLLSKETIHSMGDRNHFYRWGTTSGHLQIFDLDSKKIIENQKIKLEINPSNSLIIKQIDGALLVLKNQLSQLSKKIVQHSLAYEIISLETREIIKSDRINLKQSVRFLQENNSSNNFTFIDNKLLYISEISQEKTIIKIVYKAKEQYKTKTVSFDFQISDISFFQNFLYILSKDNTKLIWVNLLSKKEKLINLSINSGYEFLSTENNILLLMEKRISKLEDNNFLNDYLHFFNFLNPDLAFAKHLKSHNEYFLKNVYNIDFNNYRLIETYTQNNITKKTHRVYVYEPIPKIDLAKKR
jgi:hypothetical protein